MNNNRQTGKEVQSPQPTEPAAYIHNRYIFQNKVIGSEQG